MRKVRTWLVVLAAALVGATALSTPAMAATLTQAGTHGHVCRVLGKDGFHQGVICADISVVGPINGGSYEVYADAEAVCETQTTPANPVQCANVIVTVGIEDSDGGELITRQCGHANGPCPTPRYIVGSPLLGTVPNGGCNHNVWGTVWAFFGTGPKTTIELPKSSASPFGKDVDMDSMNLSTAHFEIGNGC